MIYELLLHNPNISRQGDISSEAIPSELQQRKYACVNYICSDLIVPSYSHPVDYHNMLYAGNS